MKNKLLLVAILVGALILVVIAGGAALITGVTWERVEAGPVLVLKPDMDQLNPDFMSGWEPWENHDLSEKEMKQTVVDVASQVLEQRLRGHKLSGARVSIDPDKETLQMQVPHGTDISHLLDMVANPAFLSLHLVIAIEERSRVFRAMDDHLEGDLFPLLKMSLPGKSFEVSAKNISRVRALVKESERASGIIPKGMVVRFSGPPVPESKQVYYMYLLEEEPGLRADGIRRASAHKDESRTGNNWMVHIDNGAAAALEFQEFTGNNLGRELAIALDGVILSAPTIMGRIGATWQITAEFSRQEADALAITLNSGSLPAPLVEVSRDTEL